MYMHKYIHKYVRTVQTFIHTRIHTYRHTHSLRLSSKLHYINNCKQCQSTQVGSNKQLTKCKYVQQKLFCVRY